LLQRREVVRLAFLTQKQNKMKTIKLLQFTIVTAALALVLPARADKMSVPTAASPAFTFEAPAGWKPKADAKDESAEAMSADGHAYLLAWMVTTTDPDAEKDFANDLEATLKDSLKSVDKDSLKMEPGKIDGADAMVISGTGLDKREGNKVDFHVAIFDAGKDKVGIVYADYDKDSPKDTMATLVAIVKSIKITKK
jgi:hypothetical protein